MENEESLFRGSQWLQQRLSGPDKNLWRRARKMFLFNQNLSSALNLFNFNYRAITSVTRPEGIIIKCKEKKTNLANCQIAESRPGGFWKDGKNNSIRILLDRIVTRWKPEYLDNSSINSDTLHPTLTPEPLREIPLSNSL
jgi:hypothetical protein